MCLWGDPGESDSLWEVRGKEVVSTTTEWGRERIRCRREVDSAGSSGSTVLSSMAGLLVEDL
jgi:hypothetical protein